jgi:hypothetical protein
LGLFTGSSILLFEIIGFLCPIKKVWFCKKIVAFYLIFVYLFKHSLIRIPDRNSTRLKTHTAVWISNPVPGKERRHHEEFQI